MSTTTTSREQSPPAGTPYRRAGDRVFSAASRGAGSLILVALAGVAVFLIVKSWPAVTAPAQDIPGEGGLASYVVPLAFGTILSAALALLMATPLAVGIALFTSHYAPRRLASTLGYVVDLLAAVPSIIYGLWGLAVLAPRMVDLSGWLERWLGFLPFFEGPVSSTGRTMLTVSVVLAVMILPIITAVSREVFLQTPRLHEEAALALGATRWEMIRTTVLPFGKSGVISAAMLGLGRALGETMAVAIILSPSGGITFNLIGQGNPSTIAANIALQFPESTGLDVNTLIASGLVLFVLTLVVNVTARAIVGRGRERAGYS